MGLGDSTESEIPPLRSGLGAEQSLQMLTLEGEITSLNFLMKG